MKFLFLTQYYVPEVGASQIRLHSVAKALLRQGHSVRVFTGMPSYPTGRVDPSYRRKVWLREDVEGVPVFRTWLIPARELGVHRVLNYASFAASSLLPCLSAASYADVLFAEVPPPTVGITAALISRARRLPLVLNLADLWPDWALSAGILRPGVTSEVLRRVGKFLYRRASFITCVTSGLLADLRSAYDVPENKLLYLPNGVDTNLFPAKGPSFSDGLRFFVYAGNHGVYNWPIVIVQAARLLGDKRPEVRFMLIGDGSQKRDVVSYCQEHGLKNVDLLEPVSLEKVTSYFGQAYAAIVTYKRGFLSRPAKLLPAMASGLPIVYSGEGEGARLVRETGCGLVVPPEDPCALAEAVEWLCDHPSVAREYGLAGARLVHREYSWDALVRSWVEQLSQRLNSRGSGRLG